MSWKKCSGKQRRDGPYCANCCSILTLALNYDTWVQNRCPKLCTLRWLSTSVKWGRSVLTIGFTVCLMHRTCQPQHWAVTIFCMGFWKAKNKIRRRKFLQLLTWMELGFKWIWKSEAGYTRKDYEGYSNYIGSQRFQELGCTWLLLLAIRWPKQGVLARYYTSQLRACGLTWLKAVSLFQGGRVTDLSTWTAQIRKRTWCNQFKDLNGLVQSHGKQRERCIALCVIWFILCTNK